MSKVFVLQHIGFEKLGTIANALEQLGATYEYVRGFEGQEIPSGMEEASGLIVMGGPMGVYEQGRYPFLADEIRLIKTALDAGKPILGTCLGSELLASALGARVAPSGTQEIGWYPIRLTGQSRSDRLLADIRARFVGFHWHGDFFDLPEGAVPLALSEKTPLQAFRHGDNAYGFLFHMEATERIIGSMVDGFADELEREGIDGQALIAQSSDYLPELQSIGSTVFSRWAELLP
ncbi:MAG TPA: gamma-glutamyl-gamma-aminobutyrate hydrolase family protein [Blastocatellia bacterium]|nr:gamma-glutamyl-gamma-aminobutyrate hydrolase family protein [Blastocatellia bacterium]